MIESRGLAHPGAAALGLLVLAAAACDPGPDPAPMEVTETSIRNIRDAVLEGRTTCRIVVQAHLDRIAAYDQDTGLGAVTELNPRALAVADSIDQALARGEAPGDLVCAPLLVKDNFDTHDLPTTGGSIALAGSIPPEDAFMVRRIREEGAVIVAKTNMGEWAFSPRQTVSSSYGRTANAYALDRTPAGSSGGTASGVAASFGVAGLGTDTGNSIRGPSSHLALVGIRSTLGLTSRAGVVPLAFDRDVAGPMARSVDDAARIFNVVAGYDPRDPYTELGRDRVEDDYTAFLDPEGLQGARLGLLELHANAEDADTAVFSLFEEALEDLERFGARVDRSFEIPELTELLRQGVFCRRFRYDMANYLASLGEDAPIRDVAEVLDTGEYGPDVESGLQSFVLVPADVHPTDHNPPCPDFHEHPGRQALQEAVVQAMDAAGVDAFVFPTWSHPPAHLDRANEEYRGDNSQGLVPAAGLPAITVPMGYSYGRLPAGLQIAARPWDDALLFRLAYAYEQGTRHRVPPAAFPPLDPLEDHP